MLGLSKQVRQRKPEDYFSYTIDIITLPSSPHIVDFPAFRESYGGGFGTNAEYEVNWGDGSPIEYLADAGAGSHTYGSTGTFQVSVFCRVPNEFIAGIDINGPATPYDIDFSGLKNVHQIEPVTGGQGNLTLPEEYLPGPIGLNVTALRLRLLNYGATVISGPSGATSFLDLTPWNGVGFRDLTLYGSGVPNRIKLGIPGATQVNTSSGTTLFLSTPGFVAIGPSADNPTNFDCDLRGLQMGGNPQIVGTGSYGGSDNIERILIDSSSWLTGGSNDPYSFLMLSTGVTSVDISSFPGRSSYSIGSIRVNTNPNLETVILPSTPLTNGYQIRQFYAYSCNLQGSLDLSVFDTCTNPSFGLDFRVNGNAGLTQFTIPDGASAAAAGVTLQNLTCSATGITGVGNYNTYTNIGNINSSSINISSTAIGSTATINEILEITDAGSTGGFSTRSLLLSGIGMPGPDGSSGGFDGITAKANLITKGWTVTTN